jgi:DNA-binding MarR family transcriptional regulator
LVEDVNHLFYSVVVPSVPRPISVEAYAVARRLHEASDASRLAFEAIAASHGCTAPQARFILRLFEPTAMKDLAEHLGCDKSNITGIAARLIQRGFVKAKPGPDRRVKLLELTNAGHDLRTAVQQQVGESSPAMTRLTDTERRTLVRLLNKLHAPETSGLS